MPEECSAATKRFAHLNGCDVVAGFGGGAAAYDHIVVGAGSAECVLANRLSADPERAVVLIEARDDEAHVSSERVPQ